jgi:hypothetical protein
MEEQLPLLNLQPIVKPTYEPEMTLRQRWWSFHCQNLGVYDALRLLALDLKRRGFRKVGVALLFERLRWEYFLQTRGDAYKLNNSFRALYARFLMSREPELRNFFETRRQPSEDEDDK